MAAAASFFASTLSGVGGYLKGAIAGGLAGAAAGALATTKKGALPAMPYRAELLQLINEQQ